MVVAYIESTLSHQIEIELNLIILIYPLTILMHFFI